MKSINKISWQVLLFLSLISTSHNAVCQNHSSCETKQETKITVNYSEEIIWNILTYRMYEYFSKLISKEKGVYKYDIKEISSLFPPDTCEFNYVMVRVNNLSFPDTNYALYDFSFDIHNYYCQNSNRYIKIAHSVGYAYDKHHLIAIRKTDDEQTPNLIYLSGNFFVDNTSSFWELSSKDTDSFIDYLTISSYKFQLDTITFLKKKGNKLIYNGKDSNGNEILLIVCLGRGNEVSYKCKNCTRTIPDLQPLLYTTQYINLPY